MTTKSFSEKRWVELSEPTPQNPQGGMLAVVAETKPVVQDPNAPPVTLFVLQTPQNPISRAELVRIVALFQTALDDAPESKILAVPPGTRLAPPLGR
jgi:hypothetical protein